MDVGSERLYEWMFAIRLGRARDLWRIAVTLDVFDFQLTA